MHAFQFILPILGNDVVKTIPCCKQDVQENVKGICHEIQIVNLLTHSYESHEQALFIHLFPLLPVFLFIVKKPFSVKEACFPALTGLKSILH
ncbi:MAG: hypothetical protein CMJ38_08580 [Phycisphaerae bacterium]|nr:hypothetical protein [Phycisphaerae bacterium]|tara:strand:+ start:94 stop:369 length:276 start_codon:yes stop_codon:yes gene_type:complete